MVVNKNRSMTRRHLLKLGGLMLGVGIADGCAPVAQPTPTKGPESPKAATTAAPVATVAPAPVATPAPTQAPAAITKTAGPKRGGTLTVGRVDTFNTFNPLEARFQRIRRTMFNTLAHYDEGLNLQPELAEKFDFSADGKTVSFKLRQGVKYHSGREFTSADVRFTWEYATTNERVTQRPLYQTVKEVDTPDKYSVVFHLDASNASIMDFIDTLQMLDKETVQDNSKTGVGTGPFKLDTFVPNDRIELVPFKDYWDKGKPYIDRLVVRQIPDLAALAINLEADAIDLAYSISYVDGARLRDSTGGKFTLDMGAKGQSIFDIGINCKQAPFTDRRVRQAVAWSIDRDRFARTALQGMGTPTCLIWPPHSWAYFKDLQGKIGYDLDKAKALLAEAGVGGGFDTEMLTSSKRGSGYGELAQILQADLKKIGVNAKIADLEPAQYDTRANKGEITLLVHSYGRANRVPSTALNASTSWKNEKEGGWTHYESAEYDKLRSDLQATIDRNKAMVIARQVQELVLTDCFTLPVSEAPIISVYRNYIRGLWYDMENSPFLGDAWLDK